MSNSRVSPPQPNPFDSSAIASLISMTLVAAASMLLSLIAEPTASELHVDAVQAAQAIEPGLSCNGSEQVRFDPKLIEAARPHFGRVVGTLNSLRDLLQSNRQHDCRPAQAIPSVHRAENDDEAITRLTTEGIGSLDRILAIYYSDSNLPRPMLQSLQTLRSAFVRIAYMKGDIDTARIFVCFVEAAVLLLALSYMMATLWIIWPNLHNKWTWVNFAAVAATAVTMYTSFGMLRRDSVNAAYFVTFLMFISVVYAKSLASALPKEQNCGLTSFVRLLLWGASSYFVVLLAVAIAYFYGELSVGALYWRPARLNVATAFWTVALSVFAIHFLRKHERTGRRVAAGMLCLVLGPGACAAAVAYYYWNLKHNATYPGNLLYHSKLDVVQSRAALVEIALSRLMISLPLLAVILRRFLARIRDQKSIRDFLGATADPTAMVALEILPRFWVRLRPDGVLFPNPDVCLDGSRSDATEAFATRVTTSDAPRPDITAGRMELVAGLLRSTRPMNVVMALVLATVAYIATAESIGLQSYAFLLVSVGFAVSGSFIVNDVADRAIDRINKPTRPVAAGAVSSRTAIVVGMLLLCAAPLFARFVSESVAILCFAVCIASIVYSFYLKSRYGLGANVLSAILTAMLCFVGFEIANPSWPMIGISIAVFFAALAREIAKDVEDLPGDRLFRKSTLAMSTSPATATNAAIGVAGGQIAASYIPYALGYASPVYFAGVTIANIILLHALSRAYRDKAAGLVQRGVKVSMVMYLVTYVAVLATMVVQK
jgi:geranylgeranylglycerol-phosphate geranylgeranyltransferase